MVIFSARCRHSSSLWKVLLHSCAAAVPITVGSFLWPSGLVAAILVPLAANEMCSLPHNEQSNIFFLIIYTNVITIRTWRQPPHASYYMLVKHFTYRPNRSTKWPLLCVQAGSLMSIKTLLLRTTRRRYRKSSDLKCCVPLCSWTKSDTVTREPITVRGHVTCGPAHSYSHLKRKRPLCVLE